MLFYITPQNNSRQFDKNMKTILFMNDLFILTCSCRSANYFYLNFTQLSLKLLQYRSPHPHFIYLDTFSLLGPEQILTNYSCVYRRV